jgi:hypothetical protein
MNRSQHSDAFSKTLESKPRHSHIGNLRHQFQDEEPSNGGSTVNRLSRVFETAHLDKPKPALPSKPPSLRPSTKPTANSEIDSTPLAFKDIRARFQQENTLPIKQVGFVCSCLFPTLMYISFSLHIEHQYLYSLRKLGLLHPKK